jgi:Pilus formation protein N terminal region
MSFLKHLDVVKCLFTLVIHIIQPDNGSVRKNMSLFFARPVACKFLFAALVAGFVASTPLDVRANSVAPTSGPTLSVTVDQAMIAKLPAGTATVVIGNPAIADVTIQKNGVMVVTGKTYGLTNLIALDASGGTVGETRIKVQPLNDQIMVVQRGLERESFTCSPTCERTLRLGDSEKHFGAIISQTGSRNSLATQR